MSLDSGLQKRGPFPWSWPQLVQPQEDVFICFLTALHSHALPPELLEGGENGSRGWGEGVHLLRLHRALSSRGGVSRRWVHREQPGEMVRRCFLEASLPAFQP